MNVNILDYDGSLSGLDLKYVQFGSHIFSCLAIEVLVVTYKVSNNLSSSQKNQTAFILH